MRSGARALSILAVPLNVELLQALEGSSQSPTDLRRAVGFPPQSTMRVYSRELIEAGVLRAERHKTFPSTATYSLTPAGRALLQAAIPLHEWLQAAPGKPISLASRAAKSVVKALVEAWSTAVIRALPQGGGRRTGRRDGCAKRWPRSSLQLFGSAGISPTPLRRSAASMLRRPSFSPFH